MKLTVNKYLNTRIGSASTTAPCKVYKSPGDTIDIDDIVVGDEIEGNAIWYHCSDDGCYYWSGGIAEIDFILSDGIIQKFDDIQKIKIFRAVKNYYVDQFRKNVLGFKGIGIGTKNDIEANGLALIIFVFSKLPKDSLDYTVPDTVAFRGIKVPLDVKPVGNPNVHISVAGPNLDSGIPLGMGGNIYPSTDKNAYGSRTLVVNKTVNKNTISYILSCFHVLLYDLVNDNDVISYNGVDHRCLVPALANIDFVTSYGRYSSIYDYALARLDDDIFANNLGSFGFKGYYRPEELDGLKNKKVRLAGATSGWQIATIQDLNCDVSLSCGKFERPYEGLLATEKTTDGGDSGAPVIDDSNKLIGYVVGGGSDANRTYILPVYNLFFNQGLSLK